MLLRVVKSNNYKCLIGVRNVHGQPSDTDNMYDIHSNVMKERTGLWDNNNNNKQVL